MTWYSGTPDGIKTQAYNGKMPPGMAGGGNTFNQSPNQTNYQTTAATRPPQPVAQPQPQFGATGFSTNGREWRNPGNSAATNAALDAANAQVQQQAAPWRQGVYDGMWQQAQGNPDLMARTQQIGNQFGLTYSNGQYANDPNYMEGYGGQINAYGGMPGNMADKINATQAGVPWSQQPQASVQPFVPVSGGTMSFGGLGGGSTPATTGGTMPSGGTSGSGVAGLPTDIVFDTGIDRSPLLSQQGIDAYGSTIRNFAPPTMSMAGVPQHMQGALQRQLGNVMMQQMSPESVGWQRRAAEQNAQFNNAAQSGHNQILSALQQLTAGEMSGYYNNLLNQQQIPYGIISSILGAYA